MAYAKRCPSCGGQAGPARSSRCSKCGSQTGWDSYRDYLMARHEIHRGGLRKAIGGTVALAAGVSLVVLAVALVVHSQNTPDTYENPMFVRELFSAPLLLLLVAIAVTFVWLGLRQLRTALPMLRFY